MGHGACDGMRVRSCVMQTAVALVTAFSCQFPNRRGVWGWQSRSLARGAAATRCSRHGGAPRDHRAQMVLTTCMSIAASLLAPPSTAPSQTVGKS